MIDALHEVYYEPKARVLTEEEAEEVCLVCVGVIHTNLGTRKLYLSL